MMIIDSPRKDAPTSVAGGWLEVDSRWLAGLWGLEPTGEVKCVLGRVHVGVRGLNVKPGQVVVGLLAHAVVPTGIAPKSPGRADT